MTENQIASFDQINTEIIRDLNDKTLLLCFGKFGQNFVINSTGGDAKLFRDLVNKLDEEVSKDTSLEPEQFGRLLFKKIHEALNSL